MFEFLPIEKRQSEPYGFEEEVALLEMIAWLVFVRKYSIHEKPKWNFLALILSLNSGKLNTDEAGEIYPLVWKLRHSVFHWQE